MLPSDFLIAIALVGVLVECGGMVLLVAADDLSLDSNLLLNVPSEGCN